MISLAYGMGMLLALTRERPRAEMIWPRHDARLRRGVRPDGAGRASCSPPAAPAAICFPPRRWPSRWQARLSRRSRDRRARRAATPARFRRRASHIIPSATFRGRDPLSLAKTGGRARQRRRSRRWRLLPRLKPAVVVGFGGYPTLPPLLAATLRGIPTVIHEQNAVMGRANRLLAPRVRAIATGFPGVLDDNAGARCQGDRHRQSGAAGGIAAAATPYPPLADGGTLRLLVFGGSQGARVMADIVPPAIERLEPRPARAADDRAAGPRRGSAARPRHLRAARGRAARSRRSSPICRRASRRAI